MQKKEAVKPTGDTGSVKKAEDMNVRGFLNWCQGKRQKVYQENPHLQCQQMMKLLRMVGVLRLKKITL